MDAQEAPGKPERASLGKPAPQRPMPREASAAAASLGRDANALPVANAASNNPETPREKAASETPKPRAYVLSFESTHAAMASEAALEAAHAGAAMIPTPRAISAGCGMSLRFLAQGDAAARETAALCVEARGLAALYEEIDAKAYALVERI